ncbi:hypothetical protein GQ457_14G014980 [Hibiscus cannabinus]
MPNDGTNLLEVPGKRLPNTGSNMVELIKKNTRTCAYQRGGKNKVKVKDLKPKRIKDYLECKISQRRFRPNIINRPMIFIVKRGGELREKPSFTTSRHVLNLPPGED